MNGPVQRNDITQLRVFIFGPRDLGLEVAKKLIEGGLRNLTLYYDNSKVKFESSSHLLPQYKSQPDLSQNDIVNQTIKSWTSLYPGVNVADRETNKAVQCDTLKEYHIVVLTEFNWKFLQFCRQNKISVVTAQTNGPFGRVLFDFAGLPPPTAPPLLRSSRLDPTSKYDGAAKAVAGADAGGKNEILDKTSLRLFEQFDGNRPAFAECPASKSNFVPTIHAAYTALNRFKTKNASKSAVLNYETFRSLVDDHKLPQSKMEGKLLEEFHNHLDRRIPLVNNYIGSVVAQEILKFWIEKSHPVYQQLILYGGEFRFPISFSKVSCDPYVGGRGQESSKDLDIVLPQIQIAGTSENVENMESVPYPDQDQKLEPETPQLSAPELVPESEPEPEPKPEHKPNSKPVPKPSELELPQTSGWEAAKSRKQKWSFNTNDKRSKKIAKQEVQHAHHQSLQLPPPIDPSSVHQLYGRNCGIQLRNNSCYMDSTLFSMFCCTSVFDEVVLRPRGGDSRFAECVKWMLQGIVTKLREDMFVSGDVVMRFRQALVNEGNFTTKLLGTFMDPEEFFYILFNKALDLPRFFTYNTRHGDFAHQIFLPKSQGRPVATVQDLFEASMKYNGDLKLARMPHPALIILMPRSNGSLVGYQKIVPNLHLDLTGVMTDPLVSNLKMKLMAVVCVAGYHYTSFVRCGDEWLFFDSMGPSVFRVPNCSTIISEAETNLTENPFDWSGCCGHWRSSFLTDRIFRNCQYCIYEPEDEVLQET